MHQDVGYQIRPVRGRRHTPQLPSDPTQAHPGAILSRRETQEGDERDGAPSWCAPSHTRTVQPGPRSAGPREAALRAAGENPRAAVDALLDAALGARGKDNVSIILVTVRA